MAKKRFLPFFIWCHFAPAIFATAIFLWPFCYSHFALAILLQPFCSSHFALAILLQPFCSICPQTCLDALLSLLEPFGSIWPETVLMLSRAIWLHMAPAISLHMAAAIWLHMATCILLQTHMFAILSWIPFLFPFCQLWFPKWLHMAPYGAIWLAPWLCMFEKTQVQVTFIPYAAIWSHMEPYRAIWSHMAGEIWDRICHMEPYEAIWSHMARVIWSHLKKAIGWTNMTPWACLEWYVAFGCPLLAWHMILHQYV